MLVYGGAGFVSSLIENGLLDELNLFIHPVAIANGMRIFNHRKPLARVTSVSYPCGVVVNTYKPT
jgi:dihydrofolate reductase